MYCMHKGTERVSTPNNAQRNNHAGWSFLPKTAALRTNPCHSIKLPRMYRLQRTVQYPGQPPSRSWPPHPRIVNSRFSLPQNLVFPTRFQHTCSIDAHSIRDASGTRFLLHEAAAALVAHNR